MRGILVCITACLLAACAPMRPPLEDESPCAKNEASYDCQVERYNKVHVD